MWCANFASQYASLERLLTPDYSLTRVRLYEQRGQGCEATSDVAAIAAAGSTSSTSAWSAAQRCSVCGKVERNLPVYGYYLTWSIEHAQEKHPQWWWEQRHALGADGASVFSTAPSILGLPNAESIMDAIANVNEARDRGEESSDRTIAQALAAAGYTGVVAE